MKTPRPEPRRNRLSLADVMGGMKLLEERPLDEQDLEYLKLIREMEARGMTHAEMMDRLINPEKYGG